jgi:8-amino-7-oxononanoate synthase
LKIQRYARLLESLESRQARRELRSGIGVDFTSNDYLGLAGSPRLTAAMMRALERGVPCGAAGSRLLRGNHPEHERLEAEAARFFKSERTLLFGSGYAANLSVLATLPQRGDLILHDEYIHASVHDGIKLGRAAAAAFAHNDVTAAEDAIKAWRAAGGIGTPWIAVESLYSMDGDRAPLADLRALAQASDAYLLIDEAHATGVFGVDGRGLAAEYEGSPEILALHTGGKALGLSGALVSGAALLCDFLVNRARPFVFATAPSPLIAAALSESLRILADEPERRARLQQLSDYAATRLGQELGLPSPGSQILPVIIGESGPTLEVAAALRAAGFDVRAIRPPTVPAGTARLRISITLNVDEAAIDAMLAVLKPAMNSQEAQRNDQLGSA